MTTDWKIRVYAREADADPCATWIIVNRTQHEADREASADVARDYPDAADWSIEPVVASGVEPCVASAK